MKNSIRVLVALMTAVMVCASGFNVPAMFGQQKPPKASKLQKLLNKKLPASAGKHLTKEMWDKWNKLTPAKRKEIMDQFAALVGPEVQKAYANEKAERAKKSPFEMGGAGSKRQFANPFLMREPIDPVPEPPFPDPLTVFLTADPASGPAPLTVSFGVFTSSFIVDYSWSFGDGHGDFTSNPVHTYTMPGDYLVQVQVIDEWGRFGTAAAIISVSGGVGNQPPQVFPSAAPTSGSSPLTVNFAANASDPDGFISSYSWNFGDGTTSSQANPAHTYFSPGFYTATVTVSDNGGLTASGAVGINVSSGFNQPPSVSISAFPTSGQAPLAVSFGSSAHDPDGWIVSYSWTFGDGGTSSAANPSHTYQQGGIFTARLTVTDNGGASATASVNIKASGVPPSGDQDQDGLPDNLETQLADSFTPAYFLSRGEQSNTGLARFADTQFSLTPIQVFPTTNPMTPFSYYRVTPLGMVNGQGYIQVDYLSLWNKDDGLHVGGDCEFFLSVLLGLTGFGLSQVLDGLAGHAFDAERQSVRLFAPVVGGQFNPDPNAYRMDFLFTAAHENDIFSDHSQEWQFVPPAPPGFHTPVAMTRSKHASYAFFNPDRNLLLADWLIFSVYAAIDFYCWFGDPFLCAFYYFAADVAFFSCFIEDFQDQGGTLTSADNRVNVGETHHPSSGSSFILHEKVRTKLDRRWRIP